MSKKFFIIIVLALVVVGGVYAYFARRPKPAIQTGAILYYGDTCPHCKVVEEYITKNNIAARFPLTQKEVFNNQSNAREMSDKAKACGLTGDQIGVPFLWDSGQCVVGDQTIIDYLGKK